MFVGAHEVFHFLRHSRKISGRNRENEGDEFALEQLSEISPDGEQTCGLRRNDRGERAEVRASARARDREYRLAPAHPMRHFAPRSRCVEFPV